MDVYSKPSRKRPTSPLSNNPQPNNKQLTPEQHGLLELENYIKYGNCNCMKITSSSSSSSPPQNNKTIRCRCIKSHKFETTRQQFSNNKEQAHLRDRIKHPQKLQTPEKWLTISLHIRNEVKLGTGLIEMDNMLDTQNHNFPNSLTNASPYFESFNSTEIEILSPSKVQKSGTFNKIKDKAMNTFSFLQNNSFSQHQSYTYNLPHNSNDSSSFSSNYHNMQNGSAYQTTPVYDVDRAVNTYFHMFKTIHSDLNSNTNQFFEEPLNFYQLNGKIRLIMKNNDVFIENKSDQSIFIQSSYVDYLIKERNSMQKPDKLSAIYKAFLKKTK